MKKELTMEEEIAKAAAANADTLRLFGWGRDVPREIRDIPALRHLALENFHEAPAWLAEMPFLESLEMTEVRVISGLLPHLWKLSRLKSLKMKYIDDLTELPASFAKLQNLKELNLDGAEFEHFPPAVGELKQLEAFSFEYCECPLEEVFGALAGMPFLRKIRLKAYEENRLPASFSRLQLLEEIDFSDWTELRELPESLGGMRGLRILDLANYDYQLGDFAYISELPESLCDLPCLHTLDLYGLSELKRLPRNFSHLRSLRTLDVMNSGLESLELSAEQKSVLEKLCIHKGQVRDFQPYRNLKDLYVLNVGHSGSGFSCLSVLKNLEKLEILGGNLKSTEFLTELENLRELILSCDFETLPAGIERLKHLEKVTLVGATSLTTLPESLGSIQTLRELEIRRCDSIILPESLEKRSDLILTVSLR